MATVSRACLRDLRLMPSEQLIRESRDPIIAGLNRMRSMSDISAVMSALTRRLIAPVGMRECTVESEIVTDTTIDHDHQNVIVRLKENDFLQAQRESATQEIDLLAVLLGRDSQTNLLEGIHLRQLVLHPHNPNR